jgi:hypothetical protein
MRTRATAATLAAALLAAATAGCSSSSKPAAQTLPATTATMPAAGASGTGMTATAAAPDLAAELLTVSDFPAGWTSISPTASKGGAPSCAALNNGPWKTLPAHAEADFQQSQLGPYVTELLAAGTPAAVAQAWAGFAAATSECRTFTSGTGAGTATFNLQSLSFPSYGDATYAFAVTATMSGMTVSGDIVAVRKNSTLVQIIALSLGASVPVALVEQAVSAAVGHIR